MCVCMCFCLVGFGFLVRLFVCLFELSPAPIYAAKVWGGLLVEADTGKCYEKQLRFFTQSAQQV